MIVKKGGSAAPTQPTKIGQFRPSQAIFKEGEDPRSLFIIRKGTVAIRKMKGAAQIEIARLYANEVLGELSFFDRAPRSASAIALTEAEVIEIEFSSLETVYQAIPDYMRTIMAAMAERLRKADDMIRRLQRDTIKEDGTAGGEESAPSASDVLAALEDADETGSNDPTGV